MGGVHVAERSRGPTATAIVAGFPVFILFVSALPIVLSSAESLGLGRDETSSWILALYGIPSVLAAIMSLRYRQPLLFTGNIVGLVFLATLGGEYTFAELAGATALAGAVVFIAGLSGLTGWIASLVPAPIVWV